ncbi:MAG: dTDP-4-dehydrorhamnose reductase [candidate division NC10 bacterium]|nr:dTDP-4-dehydrorhamnose reductase [candidate division NC10 bacterium]
MRIVITGAEGQLGVELVRALAGHGEVTGCTQADLDVTNPGCADCLAGLRPDWVVHAAAATDVDKCERDPEGAMAVNAEGTRRVAEGCRRAGAGLVYLSTDYVFDGQEGRPYTEEDAPAPLNVYGRSKLEGERATRSLAPRWVIIRTAWLYGTHGRNFVKTVLGKVRDGERLQVVDDQVGSPTYARDLADAVALLLSRGLTGLYHVTSGGACSWYEFAREILRLSGSDLNSLSRITSAELNRPARRPAYSVLENAAWRAAGLAPLRAWPEALAAMLAALRTVNSSTGRLVN